MTTEAWVYIPNEAYAEAVGTVIGNYHSKNKDTFTLTIEANSLPQSPSSYMSFLNDGDEIWDKLIGKHANISMVVCGHWYLEGIAYSTAIGVGALLVIGAAAAAIVLSKKKKAIA